MEWSGKTGFPWWQSIVIVGCSLWPFTLVLSLMLTRGTASVLQFYTILGWRHQASDLDRMWVYWYKAIYDMFMSNFHLVIGSELNLYKYFPQKTRTIYSKVSLSCSQCFFLLLTSCHSSDSLHMEHMDMFIQLLGGVRLWLDNCWGCLMHLLIYHIKELKMLVDDDFIC